MRTRLQRRDPFLVAHWIQLRSLLQVLSSECLVFVSLCLQINAQSFLVARPDPCGPHPFESGPKTALHPGVNILRFEETITHTGAPFRIALAINTDASYDTYVLDDHIPHWDA